MSNEIRLLDGSIGQELVKRLGGPLSTMWASDVVIEKPELVFELHKEYFDAGASIATTATYSALQDRLDYEKSTCDIDQIWTSAINAAVTARDENGYGFVAGSIGPLIGSYVPSLCPPPADAEIAYGPIVEALAPKVDIFLIETMSSVNQAIGALRAVENARIPVWIALTVDDFDGTKLRSGEDLKEIEPILGRYTVQAVLINCARPEAVSDGVKTIKRFGLPFGAYANGFTLIKDEFKKISSTVAALEKRKDLTDQKYVEAAMEWIDSGATIVGGCCEIGPSAIKELADDIRIRGHSIV